MPFCELIGQEQAIRVVQAYLRNGRLSGGYLFTGPEGVGKKKLCMLLAQALVCEGRGFDACGACPSCRRAVSLQHPDIHCIGPDGAEIRIEQIRQIQRVLSFRSYEGGRKVCVIDDAHRLNAESANCLLKVLEEPPAESLIFLISSKPALLLKTVISRCKTVKCSALPRARLEQFLREYHKVDRELAHFLAYYTGGSIGQALRLREHMGLEAKNSALDEMIAAGRAAGRPESGRQLLREDVREELELLASWLRDVMLVKAGVDKDEVAHADRWLDLCAWGRVFRFHRLYEIMKLLADSLLYLEQNVNPRLIVSSLRAELAVR
jgi:DNA polymerase-3 subunit delta'